MRTSSRSSSQRLRNIVNENRSTPLKKTNQNAAAMLGITGDIDSNLNNFINKKAPKPKYG